MTSSRRRGGPRDTAAMYRIVVKNCSTEDVFTAKGWWLSGRKELPHISWKVCWALQADEERRIRSHDEHHLNVCAANADGDVRPIEPSYKPIRLYQHPKHPIKNDHQIGSRFGGSRRLLAFSRWGCGSRRPETQRTSTG